MQGSDQLMSTFLKFWSPAVSRSALNYKLSPGAIDKIAAWLARHKNITLMPLVGTDEFDAFGGY